MAFDREQAPDGWNYERDGTPDVIFWVYNGDIPEKDGLIKSIENFS